MNTWHERQQDATNIRTRTVADSGTVLILQTKHAKHICNVASEGSALLKHFPDGDEVLQRFGHLSASDVQVSGVQEDTSPLITFIVTFALCNLVAVVWKPGFNKTSNRGVTNTTEVETWEVPQHREGTQWTSPQINATTMNVQF
jgi:hypothetical protein